MPAIEDIHSTLMKDLGVDRNMRTHRVAISGTNYKLTRQSISNQRSVGEYVRTGQQPGQCFYKSSAGTCTYFIYTRIC